MQETTKRVGGPIELLFVILVIGILLLVTINILNDSRAKARDAKRLTDIRRIQTALELYELEHSTYPLVAEPIILGVSPYNLLCDAPSGAFVSTQDACVTEFITLPKDPSSKNVYQYRGDATGYSLGFSTEKTTDVGAPGNYFAHSEGIDTDPQVK
jgi:type II secretory pathway pseudopilin PulG